MEHEGTAFQQHQNAKIILFPEPYLSSLNREDFTEVFAQNIQISGGGSRIFAALVYSGSDKGSLVPAATNSQLLTVPFGQGFRIALSRNEKQLSTYIKRMGARNVRATRAAFSKIIEVGRSYGFKLSDITLSRGLTDIVTVRDDAAISEEMHSKYFSDQGIVPTYLGFSNGESSIVFDIGMKINFTNYQREVGILVYDAVSGVLEDEAVYRNLDNAFVPKKSDDWTATTNPVAVQCEFKNREQLVAYLETMFSSDMDLKPTGGSIYFSSQGGLWGNLVLKDGSVDIYFMSEVDFDLGIRLLDALGMVKPQ